MKRGYNDCEYCASDDYRCCVNAVDDTPVRPTGQGMAAFYVAWALGAWKRCRST